MKGTNFILLLLSWSITCQAQFFVQTENDTTVITEYIMTDVYGLTGISEMPLSV